MHRLGRTGQRGAAALVVATLLAFAMLIVVAVANRNTVAEVRAVANTVRSVQAFEAAEAGLAWALVQLNAETRIDADCLPTADPSQTTFRERHLRHDGTRFVTATWDDAGTPIPLEAACVLQAAGWSCSCPADASTSLAVPAGTATAPTFSVRFEPGPRHDVIRAIASGCTRSDAPCAASSDAGHEAAARVEALFALLPSLRSAPVAALTVRGHVDAGDASLGLHNLDPASGGTAVHAGGTVSGTALRLTAPAGSALDGSVVAGDAVLAGLTPARFFGRWFAMDQRRWLAHPAALRIDCAARCGTAVSAAAAEGRRLLAIEGDLSLDGPLTLGSDARPIALVVTGALRLRGAVSLHGVVAAASVDWRDAAAGAAVHGALLAEGDYTGDAAADLVRDGAVLARLQRDSGSFARVNGSWKDF